MSGLEKIVSRLTQDTQKECEEILATANRKAAALVSEAQAQGNALIREAEKNGEALKAKTIERAESQFRSDARKALLSAKVALVDEVIDEAKNSIKTLSAENYFRAMAALALSGKQEGVGELRMSRADLQRMPADFVDQLGGRIRVSPVPAEIEDGFILKYGDIEMNFTLDALFSAFRDELRLKANALLFD